mmetsp:Transcript_1248/g.1655  ORF Transcript_1248/g.1655 Transcript_1248/m.1655 type:complete len:103 (+) Transcript_1248:210-518(+)
MASVRKCEIRYLEANERDRDLESYIYRRVLYFDASRCLVFFIDCIFAFVPFRAYEFFKYNEYSHWVWNWGFFAYLAYICFIGGIYALFVLCDVLTDFRKWRK